MKTFGIGLGFRWSDLGCSVGSSKCMKDSHDPG